MGLFGSKEDREKKKAEKAATDERRGKKLGEALLDYKGGLGPEYKSTSTGGWLRCYENELYYKKRNITIPTNQIISFEVTGQQQTNSRISVTRMATLGVFSLAAPKRSKVKEASVYIGLRDGKQLFFHTDRHTESDVHQKLADAISYYRSLQANQQTTDNQTSSIDNAAEIMKYATLLKRGVITQEEYQAKKRQLLGL